MVDIHSHILFDIDDGAKNIKESLTLCRDASENGFKAVVATPHFSRYKNIDSFVRERDGKIIELRDRLAEEGVTLSVAAGAELYLNDRIFAADDLDALTINGSRYMLCELPLGPFDISRAPMWLDELIARDYIPILAHPERYLEFYRNMPVIDEILDRGVLFQVNIDSLLGTNGDIAQMMAIDMVERKIARFIGTDAHDPLYRNNRLREKIAAMPEEITDEMIIECMSTCPRAVLDDEELP